MADNVYECMFILDSNRYAKDASGVSTELSSMIEKMGGEVMVSRLWNEQKLAYPIDGHRKGTYWLTYFKLDSLKLAPLNRECQLNANILRHLTLRVDPRLVDVLVQHARGERPLRREEPVGAAATTAEDTGDEAASDDASDNENKD